MEDVTRIEAVSLMQVTARVIPVLKFRDGGAYRISEFFMQRRAYEKSKMSNQISELIKAVSGAMN